MPLKNKLSLYSSLSEVKGIGPKKFAALKSSNISIVLDLLRILPLRYEDRTQIRPLSFLTPSKEKQGIFKAQLEKISSVYARKGLAIISAEFFDSTNRVQARWFNKTYLTKQLIPGKSYFLYGAASIIKGKITLENPDVEVFEVTNKSESKNLTPVYGSYKALSEASISPNSLRKLIRTILENISWESSFPKSAQSDIFHKIGWALKTIHQPINQEEARKASFTMAFFDQVLFQIGVLKRRENLTGFLSLPDSNKAAPLPSPFKLPFELTNAQKQALGEIVSDLSSSSDEKPPMNRLLQGDVGSGKTLVAFISMVLYCQTHAQCAFMAPTEILARQHLQNFAKFFPEHCHKATILTGSQKAKEKKAILAGIESGQYQYIFGTHALFQEHVSFKNLDYCIIDEQQRFGVGHRKLLFRKGKNPNQLLLSATPIPRTLSLTIFGDMDVSIIDELPPGRLPVETYITSSWRDVNAEILQTINKKQKVYLVCPLIESSEKMNWTSVEEAADRILDAVPDANFEVLTGQVKWDDKERIMNDFKNGNLDMLISTTVIEVGVDTPDATLIIIENADRFGLSQLHQLRGRVGRGGLKSKCLLVTHQEDTPERLSLLTSINDGFELSAEDLRLRGPGDLTGTRQSGLSHPCFSHRIPLKMVENSRQRAYEILTKESETVRDWFMKRMQESFGDSYLTFMEGG